jgi:beta-N-acetylhexosaminidase
MIGHGHYPAFDGERPRPATMSREIVSGELRLRLGYEGLVVSDDMEMGAIGDRDTKGDAAVAAIRAGCDLLLYCSDLERATVAARALTEAARESGTMRERLRDAAGRVAILAARWPIDRTHDATAWAECVEAFAPYRVS